MKWFAVVIVSVALCACSDDNDPTHDAGPPSPDTSSASDSNVHLDAGAADSSPADAAVDSAIADAAAADSAVADAGAADSAAADLEVDSAITDAAAVDSAAVDVAVDSALADAAAVDGALADAAAVDGAIADAAATDADTCQQVVLTFQGTVATVSGSPVGLDSTAYNKAASGKVGYLLCVGDSKAADPLRGEYDHGAGGPFELTVQSATIVGSNMPLVQIEDLSSDTFRYRDGDIPLDPKTRTMTLNGQDAPTLRVTLAITDTSGAAFSSDALPATFPLVPITSYPHTFSVQDDNGTLLLQLSSLTQN